MFKAKYNLALDMHQRILDKGKPQSSAELSEFELKYLKIDLNKLSSK